jgi:16S rRNA C967 or C1407 C5-methylase (RsmB/RsmF family)
LQSCEHSPELQQKEKELFYSTVRKILPASFRIGQDCPEEFRKAIENQIQEYVVGISMENDVADDSKFVGVEPIPYIPHAYQLNVDRRTIRRHPKLAEFHDWLKIITEAGFVTRQETVSMIPPIVLNVQPHHTVLDMCAAPGSKTSQLLEIITSSHNNNNNKEPLGFVVANEVEEKRAYMLVHQLRRIQSPAIFITSCDAQSIPSVRNKDDVFLYDRVLADVPCSGDGTVRKNPGIWKKWSMFGPLGLHPVQVSIAKEAARLTKVGGYLVYSTCSLNPIENEAVVAELLRSCHGTLQLVDPRMQQLADNHDRMHLLARPGWTTWKVMSQRKPKRTKGKFTPKMIAKRELFAAAAASVQQDGNQKDHHQQLENEQYCNHSGSESKSVIIKYITGTDGIDREGSEIGDQDSTALGVEQGSITPKDQL